MKFANLAIGLAFVASTAGAYGFGQLQPYKSDFVRCHDISLEVEGPMTSADWKEISKRPVQSVHTLGDADPALFENPGVMKGVREVILISSSDNSKALSDIAENFPHLEELAVSQDAPLTESDMSNIDRLNQLFFLEICTDVPNCASFAAAVPPSLKRLLLENSRIISTSSCRINLPALNYFGLRTSKLSKSFLDGMNAPNLEEVSMSRVWADPGTFQGFAKFPKLKRIFAYNMPQSSIVDLQDLQRACPKMNIVFGDSSGRN